jgi:hypothetical protein
VRRRNGKPPAIPQRSAGENDIYKGMRPIDELTAKGRANPPSKRTAEEIIEVLKGLKKK